MKDLTNPSWMKLKAALFLLIGCGAGLLAWMEHPTLKMALLLALTAWAFCRAYYFAFYVIEHYIDPRYKFSGLGSFVRYWSEERRGRRKAR